jgi:TonB family protein
MRQKCGSIREWLGAFADGELDPARTEQVRAHLETCVECRRELDQIHELHRLAKSVEHPRLAEDYWDWHRTKVWHGIRTRRRAPTPSYRPSFAWPKLAAIAAGFVVMLVVVIAGWHTLLERPSPVGRTLAERQKTDEVPVAGMPAVATPKSEGKPAASVGTAGVETEGQSDHLAQVRPAEVRRSEETRAGYVAKDAGATGGTFVTKPATASLNRTAPETKVATKRLGNELASAPAAAGQRPRTSAGKQKGRIVSGPVLLDQPTLADVDALDTGTVLLDVRTDSAGRVLSAGVRRSSGSPKLDSVAVRQVRQSRFKAAVKNNRRVPSSFEYPYRFQKKPAAPKEQQIPQEEKKQPVERKVQEKPSQSVQDNKSQSQDSGKQAAPLKEKTKK